MILIIVVTTLIGLWFCRTRSWFKWVAILFAWFLAATLLFAAYGTLDDPSGDGLVTRQIRRAAGDGPLVGFYALGFITFHVGFTLYGLFRLWDAWRDHRAAPPEAEEGSDLLPDLTGRKQLETVGVLALAGLWGAATWPSAGVPPSELADAGEAAPSALVAKANAQAEAESEKERALQEAAAEVNADPAKKSAGGITLLGASAAGLTLTYHYEIDRPGVTPRSVRAFLREEVVPVACQGPLRAPMRSHGTSYTYSFTGRALGAPVTATVSEPGCAARKL